MVPLFFLVISFLRTRSASNLISPFGLILGNMLTGLLASQRGMTCLALQSSIICLYAGRILSGTVNIFGLGADFAWIRLM